VQIKNMKLLQDLIVIQTENSLEVKQNGKRISEIDVKSTLISFEIVDPQRIAVLTESYAEVFDLYGVSKNKLLIVNSKGSDLPMNPSLTLIPGGGLLLKAWSKVIWYTI